MERGFNRRKHWRGLATRYDKLAVNYQDTLDLVEMLDWLRAVRDQQDLQNTTEWPLAARGQDRRRPRAAEPC